MNSNKGFGNCSAKKCEKETSAFSRLQKTIKEELQTLVHKKKNGKLTSDEFSKKMVNIGKVDGVRRAAKKLMTCVEKKCPRDFATLKKSNK